MPTFPAPELKTISRNIFQAAGATADESSIVADALVEANLAGHDSHGVLRIPEYVRWMEQGLVHIGASLTVALETESLLLVDGDWGFGQVMGRKAMQLAIDRAGRGGVATVSGRNCCHLGRIGDYPQMAAERGMVCVMFVNTHGGGKLVAPFGGIERRLSANPIAIGIPRRSEPPVIVDISTCAIAEGKLRNMLHAQTPVPQGSIIDAEGLPSTDASAFYGPPPGALLPFGGHKGFALALVTDILAGAISGAGCSRPDTNRIGNSFLATVIDVDRVRADGGFSADVEALIEYVKGSKLAPGFDRIMVPGEPEATTREVRLEKGIVVNQEVWKQIAETGQRYGVDMNAANTAGVK
ncbi:MAG: Ldh family oxidoreductase [Acidobacteriaceae bacterium]|nr:Ldh family oxidoreductase [Acidobacteriaceae bacterium]